MGLQVNLFADENRRIKQNEGSQYFWDSGRACQGK